VQSKPEVRRRKSREQAVRQHGLGARTNFFGRLGTLGCLSAHHRGELKSGAKIWQPVGPTPEPVAKGWLTPRQLTTAECKAMVGTWRLQRGGRLTPGSASFKSALRTVICSPHFCRLSRTRTTTSAAATGPGAFT
jgi:hypothetical protein